jgi:hypothetical protein
MFSYLGRSLTRQHDDKIWLALRNKDLLWQTNIRLPLLSKGHQNKSLLNMNSDAHTNARLRYTITNYGFRIHANAYVLSNENFGECRLSDLSHTIFMPVSIILLQSWPKSISKHSLFQMFKDERYSPPQSAVFTGYSSKSAAEHTCISIHQRASDLYRRDFIWCHI